VSTEPVELCLACRTIDRADGVEDGRLYRTIERRIGDERRLLHRVRDAQDLAADKVTEFAGSMPFVYAHAIWFGVWIALNVGLAGLGWEFDRFPFGLLTLVVSLEAIFLATLIMISQNRQQARSEIRSQIDFENNLRAEMWAVHIGQALGLDPDHVEGVIREALRGYVAEGHLSAHA
jgi:uncharacterized membrane protein